MPDAFCFQFSGFFYGSCDATVRCDDVSVEEHPVMSRYGHGGDEGFFNPFPFGFDAFRVSAFLVGIYIVNQDAVRTEVLVACTTRRLPRTDGPERTPALAGEFPGRP